MIYQPPSPAFLKLAATVQAMTNKTPEEIVLSFLGDTPIRSPGALKLYADSVDAIRAYGDQRAAEARAEVDISRKPTKLERVAIAVGRARSGPVSGMGTDLDVAKAAIEALKNPSDDLIAMAVHKMRKILAYTDQDITLIRREVFDCILAAILAEGQK